MINMMPSNEIHHLYIDESGAPSLNHRDKNYTICGVIVRPYQANKLKIKADQIKFKYWNDTHIPFHSIDIGKQKNDFLILKNPVTQRNFLMDLYGFLSTGSYRCIIVSVDKAKAQQQGWDAKKVRNEAIDTLLGFFISFLSQYGLPGQITIESSGGQDINFYKRYTVFLSKGFPSLGLSHEDVKSFLTSISFVQKNNHDIETQIADLFAYPATRQFLHDEGTKTIIPGSYENKMNNILKTKLIQIRGQKSIKRLP